MKIDMSWPDLSSKLKLISFNNSVPPSWPEYLTRQREYWGEDRISGKNSHSWSWKGNEELWLKEQKDSYRDFVEHCNKWLGKFSLGEVIPVIRTDTKATIKLCIVKNERTSWHDTVELWLFREVSFLPPRSQIRCEIYTFSTTVKADGTPTHSFQQGTPEVKFTEQDQGVMVGDAVLHQVHA
jgi:hypothetical protein